MPKQIYLILLTMILTAGCAKSDGGGSPSTSQDASATTATAKKATKVLICNAQVSFPNPAGNFILTYTYTQYDDLTNSSVCNTGQTVIPCNSTQPFVVYPGQTSYVGGVPVQVATIFDQSKCNQVL